MEVLTKDNLTGQRLQRQSLQHIRAILSRLNNVKGRLVTRLSQAANSLPLRNIFGSAIVATAHQCLSGPPLLFIPCQRIPCTAVDRFCGWAARAASLSGTQCRCRLASLLNWICWGLFHPNPSRVRSCLPNNQIDDFQVRDLHMCVDRTKRHESTLTRC